MGFLVNRTVPGISFTVVKNPFVSGIICNFKCIIRWGKMYCNFVDLLYPLEVLIESSYAMSIKFKDKLRVC